MAGVVAMGGSVVASMPSFLIRLRRWFTSSSPSVRCTEESSARSRSLAPFTFSNTNQERMH